MDSPIAFSSCQLISLISPHVGCFIATIILAKIALSLASWIFPQINHLLGWEFRCAYKDSGSLKWCNSESESKWNNRNQDFEYNELFLLKQL